MNKIIENSRMLFLDTGVVVKLLQMHPDYYPIISSVLDFAYENNATILVSQITLFEISKRAFEKNAGVLARQYREFFEHSKNVRCCDINSEVALKAAEFAAKGLKESEAFTLSAAYIFGADCILTDFGELADYTDISTVLLDEIF